MNRRNFLRAAIGVSVAAIVPLNPSDYCLIGSNDRLYRGMELCVFDSSGNSGGRFVVSELDLASGTITLSSDGEPG